MANAELGLVLRHLRSEAARELSDTELLEHFAAGHEETAFAAIVQRYGRLVLAVCRRVLGHEQDAEDAFQATFLVLAKKAHSICHGEALAGWLYGVAYHMASRAKRSAARRRNHERQAPMPSEKPPAELALRELQSILDEEVRRLPESYRAPFIVCCLEGHSKAEAARRLGWKEGTVSGRLARARKQLQKRLLARGVSLSAALGAVALADGTTRAAVPQLLAASTAEAAALYGSGKALPAGLVSPQVTSLVHGATNAMFFTGKIALFLVVGLCALAAGAFMLPGRAAPPAPPPQQLALAAAAPAKPAEAPAAPKADATGPVHVSGKILGPDNKPLAGAHLYWPHLKKEPPQSIDDVEFTSRATTGPDGRFEFDLPRKEVRTEWRISLLAHADGLGVDGAELPKSGQPADLTLRLVPDNPIRGRVLDTQGKPVAGVRVQVVGVLGSSNGRLDDFLTAWRREWQMAGQQTLSKQLHLPLGQVLRTGTTDHDGRFQITGGGVERVVLVELSGPTVAGGNLWVVNRPGFDPKAINKAILDSIPERRRIPGQPPLLYGPTFEYVAEPTRQIEGIVREVGSGKPIPRARIEALTGYDSGSSALSDAQGRYRLTGLRKLKEYSVHTMPPDGSAFIARSVRVPDSPGLQTIPFDIELARGVLVTGRVIDRATGKGVQAGMRFVPLADNKYFGKPGYDSYRAERLMTPTDGQGRFRLVTIPGPSALLAQIHTSDLKMGGVMVNPYQQAAFSAADRKRVSLKEDDGSYYFIAAGNSLEFLSIENACKVLDLDENTGPVTCDLFVERGRTQTVNFQDPDGKPLTGVTLSGMTASWPGTFRLDKATCTVYALDPTRPRKLVFLHLGRKLAGTLSVRGGEKEAPSARLVPTGSVTGRLLDQDGQPIAGAEVDLSFPGELADELYRQLGPARPTVRTDQGGRFRVELVVPDLKFGLSLHKGRIYFFAEPRVGLKQVGSGKTLDVGDLRTKPREL